MDPTTADLQAFCNRDAVSVARALIGWDLKVDGAGGVIVETEAYTADDPASHSFSGMRKSNASMWLAPGTSYVYRIYGLHFCLNVVCAHAGAVLIRALEPRHGVECMQDRRGNSRLDAIASGPGKLCQALGIDLRLDGCSLSEPPFALSPQSHEGQRVISEVVSSPRIGISRNMDAPWRFSLAGSRYLSRKASFSAAPGV